jgi:formamidopyrimidine-DNA glycosylase
LLDQRRIAGVGNIYACEALFLAGIHPGLAARRLSLTRAEALLEAVRVVLRRGLDNRGTTLRDYAAPEGAGANQGALEVFARQGQPCLRCQRPIRRVIQAGRSSFFCPGCQRR